MTEVELAKMLRKSNYTCEGVNCDECKKTNYLHVCLMADVQIYCDDILGADDNYIEKLEKENITLLDKLNLQNQRLNELKKEKEVLTNIIMDVFKLNGDLCTLCKSKGEYLPHCECLQDEACLKKLIGLYGD